MNISLVLWLIAASSFRNEPDYGIYRFAYEVYGDPLEHPQPETYWGNVNPIGSRSCYDEGKRCAETLFHDYHLQNGVRIKIIRIFNTYGPRMRLRDGRAIQGALGVPPAK